MAAVSHQVVRDVRGAALTAPEGSLIIIGAPGRSWEWALPFAVRPPFQRTDLHAAFIISPRALSCCTAPWFEKMPYDSRLVERARPGLRDGPAVGS